MCNYKDALVSYLYDELDGAARLAFESHLRTCTECPDELTAMRAVRADLLTWSPPEPDFAFRIVKQPRAALTDAEPRAVVASDAIGRDTGDKVLRPAVPSWRAWFTPAAAFAAAAVLVLAAAAGLARVEIHTGPDGFTVRTGWSAGAPFAAARTSGTQTGARDVNLTAPGPDQMTGLERRIAALESAARDGSIVRNASLVNARVSNEEVLRVVHELLAQSEGRQKSELALRIAQVLRDVDAQRVADLNNLQKGLGRIDANVAEEAQAHRELMNYILTSNTRTR